MLSPTNGKVRSLYRPAISEYQSRRHRAGVTQSSRRLIAILSVGVVVRCKKFGFVVVPAAYRKVSLNPISVGIAGRSKKPNLVGILISVPQSVRADQSQDRNQLLFNWNRKFL